MNAVSARDTEESPMPRSIKVAAAQMGPNQDGTPREAIVERMLGLLDQAIRDDVEVIAYPEMALTTDFPKRIRTDFDQFFETEVPPKALEPLLRRAAEKRVAAHVGFCEKADGKYFNTALLTDRDGRLAGVFRKIHLPGTKAVDGFAQVYEPYYFAHGDTGYEVFDCAGAKVGIADGVELIGGSCIINPLGQVLAKAATTGDELIVARIDLEQIAPVRKRWNFLGRRQPQHYGRLLMPVTETETHR